MIVDRETLEQIVLGFREDEVFMPGFKVANLERNPGQLIWDFRREPEEPEKYTDSELRFGDKLVVQFLVSNLHGYIALSGGDTLNIKYTLNWEHRGGGEDEFIGLPAPVGDGLRLVLYSVVA